MEDVTSAQGRLASATGDLTFEQALTALEQTVEELRSDDLDLARALDLYEQGTRLSAYCEHLLTAAEIRLRRADDLVANAEAIPSP